MRIPASIPHPTSSRSVPSHLCGMSSSSYSPRDWSPSLLSKYRTLLFDCDGVLWHETSVVKGAIETLKALEAKV